MGAIRAFFVGGFDWNGTTGRASVVVGLLTFGLILVVSPSLAEATGGRLTLRQVVFVLSALVTVQMFGTIVRRLHDAGRSGWWLLLAAIPYMPILLMLALLALPPTERGRRWEPASSRRLALGLTLVLALFMASRAFWTDHLLASEAMSPTLWQGDYVAAATLFRAPRRGDIVVYDAGPAQPGALQVMRVVGLAGETVRLGPEGPEIDGAPVPRETGAAGVLETLPGGPAYDVVPEGQPGGPYVAVTVPAGAVLVLADNRLLDAAFASQASLEAHVISEASVRARIVLVLASSASWRGGVPAWVRGMRWDRVWSVPV
ncbi:signal peptidase I [Roseisalinus antarcticus]|uniref:Signal peptidase I n=1 Tax=Roseisalinus antarcticus TaxID=254357 RepID=A0A1Y5SU79_9RHOB|nr:signal peptidase I [Roseisalinus antarcticus]SLN45186.1 hypothetical protein ROA7023_01861 [Roseisalinus antarcticus]